MVAALVAALAAAPAAAGGIPGDFDFYVLALSWSPSVCSAGDTRICIRGEHGFSVHGLWPQYEVGYPLSCHTDRPLWVEEGTLEAASRFMPRSLAIHEWRVHGVCSGLTADDYFALTGLAARRVVVPADLGERRATEMTPGEIEAAFVAANPGLTHAGMSVQCREGAFTEVRICMTRALEFRACAEVDADACSRRTVSVPPLH
jgi:ribonuclease T2